MTEDNIEKKKGINSLFLAIEETCTRCGLCQKECLFLQTHGLPGDIPELYRGGKNTFQDKVFECSLCGLCTAVCPEKIDPARMFLEIRRESVRDGRGIFKKHASILNYEKRGKSQRYSLYELPDNCDTIFFPGCTLPGTRPAQILKILDYLRRSNPTIGIVLDCCTKPSHDLGRQEHFEIMFSKLSKTLEKKGVKNIITACPNCYTVFTTYGPEFNTTSLYEEMDQLGYKIDGPFFAECSIHDPCVTRFNDSIQKSVRNLAESNGLTIKVTKHTGVKTLCCGEGGSVGCVKPEFAAAWTNKRTEETGQAALVSYCAGCVHFLGKSNKAFHLLDYLFEPEKTLAGKLKISKAPFTYLNRLLLKRRLKKKYKKDNDS